MPIKKGNSTKKKKLATEIVKRLRRKGFAAYFVGGCPRDMLMRKRPKDIDIATSARPFQIRRAFPKGPYSLGARFGTLLVLKNKIPFQVSTFRGKKGKKGLSLLDDLRLRDFTINGLAYDPIARKMIDAVGARVDIRKKNIRAIGSPSDRFKEDPLRLIRAVRLAVSLGFEIEPRILQAIKKMGRNIKKASVERIREELILIFTSANPARGLTLLDETGLLKQVLPEVAKLKGVQQPKAFHPEGDVFSHTLLMLSYLRNPSLLLSFACLLHDIGKPGTFQVRDRIRFSGHDRLGARMSENILKRLKLSNKDRENIVACVENHMRMMEAPKMRESTLKRLFARDTFEEELRLHYIDCMASHRNLKVWRFLTKKYKQFKRRPIIPRPLLDGYELIKMGLTVGPIFGKIHKQMVNMQLEGKLNNKAEARDWLKKKFIQEKNYA